MGKIGSILSGGTRHKGNINLLTPDQQQFLGSMLGEGQQGAQAALSGLLQPSGLQNVEKRFQQKMINPAMQALRQQILPEIQQRFGDLNASSSSALNQALARSATDLSSQLGQQFGQFYQAEAGRQQQGQLGGLGFLGGLQGQQAFQPMIQQKQGLLGPLIGAAGQIGAGLATAGAFS